MIKVTVSSCSSYTFNVNLYTILNTPHNILIYFIWKHVEWFWKNLQPSRQIESYLLGSFYKATISTLQNAVKFNVEKNISNNLKWISSHFPRHRPVARWGPGRAMPDLERFLPVLASLIRSSRLQISEIFFFSSLFSTFSCF